MAKKIIVGVMLIGLIGLLIWGGINRTLARTAETPRLGQSESLHAAEGQILGGQGFGAGARQKSEPAATSRNAAGRGQGGQGIGGGADQGLVREPSPLNGTGRGEGGQGNGGGAGQNGQAGEQPGGGYTGQNGGQNGGQGGGLAASGGDPQAEVSQWVTLQGVVESVSADTVVIVAATGEAITLDGRPWSFAQEAGFSMQAGDQVTLTGFYEDGELEIGFAEDLTSGQSIQLREQNGRPAWAGSGRWNQ